MKNVIEIQGVPHTFTLKDMSTFRIFARQTKPIADDLISSEMRAEEKMGFILIIDANEKIPVKAKKNKEV
jgi:hypothetical protein